MKKFYPMPFPHWRRGDREFNLVCMQTRNVIRFEPTRIIVRLEGHESLAAFEKSLDIAKNLVEEFSITDLFAMSFHSVRCRPMKSLYTARSTFSKEFITDRSRRLQKQDERTDFAVTLERKWLSNINFNEDKPNVSPLSVHESVTVGPVSYEEIGEKWTEFKKEAKDSLYITDHVAPRFGILADLKYTADRRNKNAFFKMETLWKFYQWAKQKDDQNWSVVVGD